MYEHIPSPLFCMWLQHQAKIFGHGYGNGYGLWLGWGSWVLAVLGIKINRCGAWDIPSTSSHSIPCPIYIR